MHEEKYTYLGISPLMHCAQPVAQRALQIAQRVILHLLAGWLVPGRLLCVRSMHPRPAREGGVHGTQRVEWKVMCQAECPLNPKPTDLQVPCNVAGLCKQRIDRNTEVLSVLLGKRATLLSCVDG